MGHTGKGLRCRPHHRVLTLPASMSHAGMRDVDNVRPNVAQHVVAKTPAAQRFGAKIFRHHIRDGDQFLDHHQSLFGAHIDGNTFFVWVRVVESR